MRTLPKIIVTCALSGAAAFAFSTQALVNSLQNFGNQSWIGNLGLEFNVGNTNLLVTHLGAFDSGQDGLNGTITVGIFDRNTQALVGSSTSLSGTSDPLSGAWRMKSLGTSIQLLAGGNYAIVAVGYGNGEDNLNTGFVSGNPSAADNGAPSYITFVGSSRYDGVTTLQYPNTQDSGPAIRYGAGNFAFAPVPEPFTVGLGIAGLAIAARRRARKAS